MPEDAPASTATQRVPYLRDLQLENKLKAAKETPVAFDKEEAREKRFDEDLMKGMLDYRKPFEPPMLRAAKSWNLIAARVRDPRVSNVLMPLIRMIGRQIITSMMGGLPSYDYAPLSQADYSRTSLWKAGNEHIDNETNMLAEQEDFIKNLVVLGNAGYEDYVHCAYKTVRVKDEKDKWQTKIVRDRSQPKIGTRSRSPWDFAFAPWARDPNGRVPKMWRDRYSWDQFADIFGNAKIPETGKWKYENVDKVLPGYRCDIDPTNDTVRYEKESQDGVVVWTLQDPVSDVMRRYANGVRVEDIPLHEYCAIQKSTLSIATNHDVFDSNFRTSASWGVGEPHLLAGLDALYQAIGNLAIDNYKLANTFLYGVKGGASTALDPDLKYLSGMRLDGEVVVSPLGNVRLADYGVFRQVIEEMCIALTGFNFRQLIGDTSKTAFEFQQRLKAQSAELTHKIGKLENGCLKQHGEVRLCFMLQHMTVPEVEPIAPEDSDAAAELIQEKRLPKEDFEYDNAGKPSKRIHRERIRVKGRKIIEEYTDAGKRTAKGFRDDGPSKGDSFIAVADVYFNPAEWIEGKRIPGVLVTGRTMHTLDQEMKFQKTQFMANYTRQRVAEAKSNTNVPELQTDLDPRLGDEQVIEALELRREAWMRGGQDEKGDKVTSDVVRRHAKKLRDLLSPSLHDAPPQAAPAAVQGVRDVDAPGFGSLTPPDDAGESNTQRVAQGAAGPA